MFMPIAGIFATLNYEYKYYDEDGIINDKNVTSIIFKEITHGYTNKERKDKFREYNWSKYPNLKEVTFTAKCASVSFCHAFLPSSVKKLVIEKTTYVDLDGEFPMGLAITDLNISFQDRYDEKYNAFLESLPITLKRLELDFIGDSLIFGTERYREMRLHNISPSLEEIIICQFVRRCTSEREKMIEDDIKKGLYDDIIIATPAIKKVLFFDVDITKRFKTK